MRETGQLVVADTPQTGAVGATVLLSAGDCPLVRHGTHAAVASTLASVSGYRCCCAAHFLFVLYFIGRELVGKVVDLGSVPVSNFVGGYVVIVESVQAGHFGSTFCVPSYGIRHEFTSDTWR